MPIEQVQVPVLDRGFLFGDAVYEVIRVYGGKCWKLGEHIDRLAASLAQICLEGVETASVRDRVELVVSRSQAKEALVYVQITRGVAPRTHRFPESYTPNELIYVQDFTDPYASARKTGARAITFPDIRWKRNDIKATSLLANCLAAQAAHEKGASEAVLVTAEGSITEGSHTSIFGVRGGEILMAPSSANVLPGITKKQVIELAKDAGIALREHCLTMSDLENIEELFMTGTPEEIVPITNVDERVIGSGQPGPVVAKLQAAFRTKVEKWLAARQT